MKRFLLLLALFLGEGNTWAMPRHPMGYGGQPYINDFGGAINGEQLRAHLSDYCEMVKRDTGVELVVVTISNLEGLALEDYAVKLFKKWGIGKKGKDKGVLVLVATRMNEDAYSRSIVGVKIEVGYGLESVLTDGVCGEIIRKNFLPAVAKEDSTAAVKDGVIALAKFLDPGHEPEYDAEKDETFTSRMNPLELMWMGGFFQIFIVFLFYAWGQGRGSVYSNLIFCLPSLLMLFMLCGLFLAGTSFHPERLFPNLLSCLSISYVARNSFKLGQKGYGFGTILSGLVGAVIWLAGAIIGSALGAGGFEVSLLALACSLLCVFIQRWFAKYPWGGRGASGLFVGGFGGFNGGLSGGAGALWRL